MGLNAAITLLGVAKQVDKATAALAPTFNHGVTGGSVITADIEQKPVDVTSGTREPLAVHRTSVAAGADPKFLAHPKSLGLWLLGLFGSVQSSLITEGRYRHVFTVGADIPWMTVFGQYGGANFFATPASKLDKGTIEWKGNDPLSAAITALSGAIDLTRADMVPTTDDTYAPYFTPVGGTFQLAAAGSVPATAVMTGGSFEINNALDAVMASGSIIPGAINPKAFTPGVKLTVMPDDFSYWRTVLTGSPAGTTISQEAVYGSFNTEFVCGADKLIVKGQKAPFTAKFPESNPGGGTAEVELESTPVRKDTSTPSLEVILENDVPSY